MPDVKISAGADPVTLVATDRVPLARSASTTAYAATMAEFASYANGAYVPNYYTSTPSMDGSAFAGSAAFVSRGDHVHPSDTSRLPLAGGTMVGFLTLNAVPTATLHAATKGYVDTATGGSTAAIPGTSYADNGGFAINQRTYVSGTALAAAAFGHDRWKGGASGCTYIFAASSGPSRSITITAGSLQQVVEGASIAGGSYMLSWIGTAQGRVGAGSYAASPVAVTGITAGANTTIEFNAGTLSQVKFEPGTVATPWVPLPAQQDLARCQRFYCQTAVHAIINASAAGQFLGTGGFFPVTMRAVPATLTSIQNINTDANLTGFTMDAVTVGGFRAYATSSAAGAIAFDRLIAATADL